MTASSSTGFPAPLVSVCGPLTSAFTGGAGDGDLRGFLELVHDTLEDAGLAVASAHRAERWGACTDDLTSLAVARRDIDWVRACRAVVAVLGVPGRTSSYRTDGTFIELGWALAWRKHLVLVGDLSAYPSLLVQGVPDIAASSVVLSPEEVASDPDSLLVALEPALPSIHKTLESRTTA